MKKYVTKLLTYVVIVFIITVSKTTRVNAYEWPKVDTTGNDPNYYLWHGKFYWFGDDSQYAEYGGSWYDNPQWPNTLYGNEWGDIQLDGAYENNGPDEFGFYSTNAWWTDGNGTSAHWNSSKGRYEKKVEADYRRDKTTPEINDVQINKSSPKKEYIDEYNDEGTVYWEKPYQNISVEVSSQQSWPGSRNLQLNDFVLNNGFEIDDQLNNKLIMYTDRNNNSNTESASKSINISVNSTNRTTARNTEKVSTMYNVNFCKDGYDYKITQRSKSNNGKETGWANTHIVKTDGEGPVWNNSPKITLINKDDNDSNNHQLPFDKVIDGMKIDIKGLKDMRGDKNEKNGVGLKYNESGKSNDEKGQYIVIYEVGDDGNSKGEGVYITPDYGVNTLPGESSDIEFNINFDEIPSLKSYTGLLHVQFVSYDLLDNISRSEVYTVEKIDPKPTLGNLKVSKYDYHDTNSNIYWMKCGSPFAIYTDASIKSEYGIFPTETSLLMVKDDNKSHGYIEHEMNTDSFDLSHANDASDTDSNPFINDVYDEKIDNSKLIYNKLANFPKNKAKEFSNSKEEVDNILSESPKNTVKTEPVFNYLGGIHWLSTESQEVHPELTAKHDDLQSQQNDAADEYEKAQKQEKDLKNANDKGEKDGEKSIYDESSTYDAYSLAQEITTSQENELDVITDELNKTNELIKENQNAVYKDGCSYKLYSKSNYTYERFIYSGNNYVTNYATEEKDSGLWINFDGTPPTGDSEIELNDDNTNANVNLKVSNVKDLCLGNKVGNTAKVGSGVKRIFALIYSVDDYMKEKQLNKKAQEYTPDPNSNEKIITNNSEYVFELTKNTNNTWTNTIDLSQFYNFHKLKFKVFAEDNVGNIGEIKEKTFELLTLKANVVKYQEDHGNINDETNLSTSANIKRGEAGTLILKTTGKTLVLKGTYPEKFKECAKEENKELNDFTKDLPQSDKQDTDIKFKRTDWGDFIVPLYVPQKIYYIIVEATRGENTKKAIVELSVEQSVLDKVRTRLR